jgi:hypothetical protein
LVAKIKTGISNTNVIKTANKKESAYENILARFSE